MLVIGLDAASQWKNFGYAIGLYDGKSLAIEKAGIVQQASVGNALQEIVGPKLRSVETALIAIDAPLGWPSRMGEVLKVHQAGDHISSEKDYFFKRITDVRVKELANKNPLEVGADKIARAAHQALESLLLLRAVSDLPIPLAWSLAVTGVEAIEVYPAATLAVRKLPSTGYKPLTEAGLQARDQIILGLDEEIAGLGSFREEVDHIFDACLCLVAAKDFLDGKCQKPDDLGTAKKEGWIWVRNE